jgi:3-oxoacyl-[acyl-carrier-protein] synthase II
VKPIAITGVGLVSPIGTGFPAFCRGLASEPGSAFRRESSVLSRDQIPDPFVAEVGDFDPTPFLGSKGLRNHDRLTLFLLVSAKLALEDAGLKREGVHTAYGAHRVGVCSATAYGSLESINELVTNAEQDPHFVNPNRFPNTVINSAAGYVSIWEDLRAPNVTVVDGNCGALDAILTSETHLRNGRADAFLVGGGEVLSESLYLAFRKLGALAEGERKYAPGSVTGEGMRLGEGAVYLAVEREADAIKRARKPYARIVGYGNGFEPPESEAALVHASARAIERTIEMALLDASLKASEIDAVCASISGLSPFDRAELAAIEKTFGPEIAIATPKTLYGETFGASGALGVASTLAWLQGVPLKPLVRGHLKPQLDRVLVLAVGFYGNVSAVIVSR